jgi:hypothetical protein
MLVLPPAMSELTPNQQTSVRFEIGAKCRQCSPNAILISFSATALASAAQKGGRSFPRPSFYARNLDRLGKPSVCARYPIAKPHQ